MISSGYLLWPREQTGWFSAPQSLGNAFLIRAFGRCVVSVALMSASLPMVEASSLPQSDSDRPFAQAVKDYNDNRFADAQAKFERIQGAHAQEAQQYIDKIKAYLQAKGAADDVMRRSMDELDLDSVESAIQQYEKAIQIKSDGPGQPTQKLAGARRIKVVIADGLKKKMTAALCDDALAAAGNRQYQQAADNVCRLADGDPTFACGGSEARELCEQYKKLLPPKPPAKSEVLAEAKAAYEGNDFPGARARFKMLSGNLRPTAKEYLDKISRYQSYMAQAAQMNKDSKYEDARAAFTNAANIKADGPGNPAAGVLRMELAEGLEQFYAGNYAAAIQHLNEYAQSKGEKQPLAHFYLGASKLARFYLTGSENAGLQQDALKDLAGAKQAGFTAESEEVSPKILQAYHDLEFSSAR
jgi:hypothetical protein